MARQLHRQARQPEVILGQPDQALRRRAIGGVSPLALVPAGQGNHHRHAKIRDELIDELNSLILH